MGKTSSAPCYRSRRVSHNSDRPQSRECNGSSESIESNNSYSSDERPRVERGEIARILNSRTVAAIKPQTFRSPSHGSNESSSSNKFAARTRSAESNKSNKSDKSDKPRQQQQTPTQTPTPLSFTAAALEPQSSRSRVNNSNESHKSPNPPQQTIPSTPPSLISPTNQDHKQRLQPRAVYPDPQLRRKAQRQNLTPQAHLPNGKRLLKSKFASILMLKPRLKHAMKAYLDRQPAGKRTQESRSKRIPKPKPQAQPKSASPSKRQHGDDESEIGALQLRPSGKKEGIQTIASDLFSRGIIPEQHHRLHRADHRIHGHVRGCEAFQPGRTHRYQGQTQ